MSARLRGAVLLLTIVLLGVAVVRLTQQGGTPAFWWHNLPGMAAFVGIPLLLALAVGGLMMLARRFGDR